jgi:putative ABC transport system permease protein
MNARRAVARWAVRLFRREWRQQVLILALLTIAVAMAIYTLSLGYSFATPPSGRFGNANLRLTVPADAPPQRSIQPIKDRFGAVDVIDSQHLPVPGSVDKMELRDQDPGGRYGGPMLRLRAGRYPGTAKEIALTPALARTLHLHLGDTFSLDGLGRVVVGMVENPGDLSDDFGLVVPGSLHADNVVVLAKSAETQPRNLPAATEIEERAASERTNVATAVLAAATVVLLLVCLVAAAGFLVVAQRRLRQLGMLAAVGATRKHLRLVLLANGAVVGAISAVAGTALALAAWLTSASALESPAGHRIDRWDLPWPFIALGLVLAVAASTAAAWWPARAVSRIPIVNALSARPPRPRPVHRSALAGVVLAGIGVACLAAGIDAEEGPAAVWLTIGGTAAIVIGVLLSSPLAIRLLGTLAKRLPVAPRLALRDLARHQGRSAAALAAISLALGISVAVAVAATAATPRADEGNLPANQVLFRSGDTHGPLRALTDADTRDTRSRIDRFAATLPAASVTDLDMAVGDGPTGTLVMIGGGGGKAAAQPGDAGSLRFPVALTHEVNVHSFRDADPLYIGTPDALRAAGLGDRHIDASADVLTAQTASDIRVLDPGARDPWTPRIQHIPVNKHGSEPRSFLTAAALARRGWTTTRAAWLVTSRTPLTKKQISAAHDVAVASGVTAETRKSGARLATIGTSAIAVGMLLALGVLAMTVGLIRGESAGDLRTLTATGATSTARRTLSATTAAGLSLVGAILGTIGAYVALMGGYLNNLGYLSRVPYAHIGAIVFGLPLLAAGGGWLLAGREPPSVGRVVFE